MDDIDATPPGDLPLIDNDPRAGFVDAAALTGLSLASIGDGFGAVVEAFQRVVGEELSRRATPVSLRDGVLRVRCASSTWASELGWQQRELIARLAVELPDVRIVRIDARAGGAAGAASRPAPAPTAAPDSPPLEPLDEATDQRLRAMVAPVQDPALRERMLAAARASEQRRRAGA